MNELFSYFYIYIGGGVYLRISHYLGMEIYLVFLYINMTSLYIILSIVNKTQLFFSHKIKMKNLFRVFTLDPNDLGLGCVEPLDN